MKRFTHHLSPFLSRKRSKQVHLLCLLGSRVLLDIGRSFIETAFAASDVIRSSLHCQKVMRHIFLGLDNARFLIEKMVYPVSNLQRVSPGSECLFI